MVSAVNGDEYEYQLMEHLLRGYDPRIRPSLNSSEALNVTFGLALAQIIDVVSISVTTLYNCTRRGPCISPTG